MRCELDRSTLAETLTHLLTVLPGKTTYPVLNNISIEVKDGRLLLRGTDLEVYLRRELPLEGASENGRVIVQGRKVAEIVREMGTERVTLSSKDNTACLEAGGVRASFVCIAPEEFPEDKMMPEGVPFEFPSATLHELFDMVSFAASRDESRLQMSGVNWEIAKSETRMVATDGHRLAFVCRKGKFPTKYRAILPLKFFAVLPKGEDSTQVFSDPTYVGMRFKDTEVVCRLLEGPYPDYERVIPRGYPGRAVVAREAFQLVLRRASVLAHPLGKLTTFEFRKKKLVVRAETPDLGSSVEELECEYTGEDLRIGFNVAYVLEMVRRMSSEKVAIELSTPLSAGVMRPLDEDPETEKTFLLMPIRLD